MEISWKIKTNSILLIGKCLGVSSARLFQESHFMYGIVPIKTGQIRRENEEYREKNMERIRNKIFGVAVDSNGSHMSKKNEKKMSLLLKLIPRSQKPFPFEELRNTCDNFSSVIWKETNKGGG